MVGTLVVTVYRTVKQLICLRAALCFVAIAGLNGCTKAIPELTALSSTTEGLDLKPASSKLFSTSGNLAFTGACDARLKSLKIKVGTGEWQPLASARDPNGPQGTDCGGRNLNFEIPKSVFGFDPAAMAEGESAEQEVQISGTSEFGSVALQKMRLIFVKDTVAPHVTITAKATINLTEAPTYAFTGTCESGLDVLIAYDSVRVTAPCVNGAFSKTLDFSARAESASAALSIVASQKDEAGNQSAPATLVPTLDRTPPDFTVSASPNNLVGSNIGAAKLTGTCESGVSIKILSPITQTLTCPTGGGPGQTVAYSLSYAASTLAENVNNFNLTVQQIDAVGNETTKTATLLYKDTTAGTVALVIEKNLTNLTNTFSGTCTAGQGPVAVNLTDAANGTLLLSNLDCAANGTWTVSPANLSTLVEGVVNVAAVQVDAHGNASAAVVGSFKIDRTPPSATIAVYPGTLNIQSTQNLQTLSGSCEAGASLNVTLAAFNANGVVVATPTVTAQPTCSGTSWSATFSLAAAALTDVVKLQYTLKATDAATNTQAIIKDSATDFKKPELVVQTPATAGYINIASASNLAFTGTCTKTDGAVTITSVSVSSVTVSTACGTESTFSTSLNTLSLADGDQSFKLSQTDAAGNQADVVVSLKKDTVKPSPATSAGSLTNTNSKSLGSTPTFAPTGGGETPSSTASGFDRYVLRVFKSTTPTITLASFPLASGGQAPAAVSPDLDVTATYVVEVVAYDKAGNPSDTFSDYWDYCPLKTILVKPAAGYANAGDAYSETVKIPKSCAQGSIVIHARGEAGRDVNGAYPTSSYGGGGVASGLFKGSVLATKTLSVRFNGAGMGGRAFAALGGYGSGPNSNPNSGGRYAWVDISSTLNTDSNPALRVVAGGGGGFASTYPLYSYENLPGLGGDQGWGEGGCEAQGDRRYCGQNGNSATSSGFVSGQPGSSGLNDISICSSYAGTSGTAGTVATNAGFGGLGKNTISSRESGGGGGGWGGGGAGAGAAVSSQCNGRAGGGGGSVVEGSALVSGAASSLIAGANAGAPEVRITLGLPSSPCLSTFTFIPPTGDATNTTASTSEVGFCVANIEAAVSAGAAQFAFSQVPASAMTKATAEASCAAVSVSSGAAKLPSNTQWQVLANIAHWTKENWILGYPGISLSSSSNYLLSGINQNVGSGGLAATNETNPCFGTNAASSCSTYVAGRRTHYMGNMSAKVWDLGGNLSEWVRDPGLAVGSYGTGLIARLTKANPYFLPISPTSDYGVWGGTAAFGLGLATGDSVPANAGLVRGGNFSDSSTNAGVFRLNATYTESQAVSTNGFRCVHEIKPPGF